MIVIILNCYLRVFCFFFKLKEFFFHYFFHGRIRSKFQRIRICDQRRTDNNFITAEAVLLCVIISFSRFLLRRIFSFFFYTNIFLLFTKVKEEKILLLKIIITTMEWFGLFYARYKINNGTLFIYLLTFFLNK